MSQQFPINTRVKLLQETRNLIGTVFSVDHEFTVVAYNPSMGICLKDNNGGFLAGVKGLENRIVAVTPP